LYSETATMVTADGEDFVVALDDLAALADCLGARANLLSLIPAGAADLAARAAAGFQALDAAAQARLAVALAVLRAPGKMAHLHHTIADETVSRAALAWSSSVPGTIVALAGTVDPRRITFWTQASLTASIRKTLAADEPLRDDEIGCKVSTPAVVVFLAALEQLRAVRLHSMLTHGAPLGHFSQAEIMDRLRDAASEDFRWPLLFTEKLIPGGLVTSLTEAEVAAALGELAQAGLVEMASQGKVPRYELSNAGKVIADGVLHDVSKVALGVTDQQGQGKFGRDIVLLVRGSFHLFLFAMAGQAGAIAALANDELAAVLHCSLRPAPPPAEDAPASVPVPAAPAVALPPPPPPSRQWYYSRAGQTEGPLDEATLRGVLRSLPPDTLVWNQDLAGWIPARDAGVLPPAVASACPHCGAPGDPAHRFCISCGRPRV
jgi:DNA-binding transcriptional ArsR family regulator